MVASILRRRPARASAALAAVLGLTSAAHAKDVWRRPRPGLRHLHRTVGVFDFHVVMVDLRAPGVRVIATPEEFLAPTRPGGIYRWRTTTAFAQSVGAEVAVNANYYDIHHGALTACGLAMSRGEAWQSSYTDRRLDCWWSAGFGSRGRGEIFDSRGKVFGPAPERWITEAVSGSPRVLDHGEVVRVAHPRHALSRNPRTVVGFDREHETLFLMVVNGREGRNQGMTTAEAGAALRELGGYDAINLDGGGSSTLYVRAEGGMVSHPADRYERPVANHLAVVFDDDPAPAPETAPETAPEAPRVPAPAIPWIPRQQPNIDLGSPRVVRAGCDASPRPAGRGAFWLLGAALAMSARRRSPRPPTRESLREGGPLADPAD